MHIGWLLLADLTLGESSDFLLQLVGFQFWILGLCRSDRVRISQHLISFGRRFELSLAVENLLRVFQILCRWLERSNLAFFWHERYCEHLGFAMPSVQYPRFRES